MIFVLQTDAAAALCPLDGAAGDAAMARIERSMAACTPSAEELAEVDSSERVHRAGGARKRKRRKMKRAGAKTKARAGQKHAGDGGGTRETFDNA